MRNLQDLVSRMHDFCDFLAGLEHVPAEVLLSPMVEGKWSALEVIAHILAYDEVFLQDVVLAIESGRQPHFPDPADNQSFNESAAALGRKLAKSQLLERAAHARELLVDHLRQLPAEAFRMKPEGRADSDLVELLDADFVSHDRSHIDQMQKYLRSRGYLGATGEESKELEGGVQSE